MCNTHVYMDVTFVSIPLTYLPSLSHTEPVPLLPKPPPTPVAATSQQPQTYALIPIQGGVPVVPQQPILVPANWPTDGQYPTLDFCSKSTSRFVTDLFVLLLLLFLLIYLFCAVCSPNVV